MNAKEAQRRQQTIWKGLQALAEIFETSLSQEMDPVQEAELARLLKLGRKWEEKL